MIYSIVVREKKSWNLLGKNVVKLMKFRVVGEEALFRT
jgi:hypothetical protein